MVRFELPDIGEGVVEAEILAWRVQEGDVIKEDEILVELLTDKAEIEIPSPYAGRVHQICFQVGEIAPVGAVLIEIDEEGSGAEAPMSPPEEARSDVQPSRSVSEPEEAGSSHPPIMPARPRSQQKASARSSPESVDAVPAVRELARRLEVDLRSVRGTGPRGRIMRRDVEAAHGGPQGAQAPVERVAPSTEVTPDPDDWERKPFRGLRRAIARRMVQARRTAAHFTYVEEIDITNLLERIERDGENAPRSPLAFIAHATTRSLENTPALNASIDDEREEIILKRKVHLGIAAATEDGLVVPVIRDAVQLSVREIADVIEALARKARENRLTAAELRGSTFTITSLGKLGGVMSTPILLVPAFREGELEARSVLNLSISVDHRITDGLVAARFIQDLKQKLEEVDFPGFSDDRSAP
jgi:pyruvate dehydrogenase E2 component (dihydrolipoamide acetyltransferase)